MLGKGQRKDINFAIPVLEHINIEESSVLANRGYDSQKLIGYIYENGGEPAIPSKKGAEFAALQPDMISWLSHIWDLYALLQS